MKKVIVLLLSILLCFSLVSCGEEAEAVNFEDKLGGSNKKPSGNKEDPILRPAVTDRATAAPADTKAPTDTQSPADRPSQAYNEIDTYSSHLTSGSLAGLIQNAYFDRDHVKITSYLEDLNGDGIRELLLTIQDTQSAGVRGYAYGTYLYTINNGRVMLLCEEYYGGGSMGGSDIVLVTDGHTGKHHAASSNFFRDGYYFNESILNPYDLVGCDLKTAVTLVAGRATVDDLGASYVNAIKAETSQYVIEDGELNYYKINNEYVTQTEYEARAQRYRTYDHPTTVGTFDNPLGK
jgi:hypothetical protein